MEFLEIAGLTEQEFILLLTIIVIGSLFDLGLKAIAMWHAARAGSKGWFILLLIINSAGILPLIFLRLKGVWFSGKKDSGGEIISADGTSPRRDV